MLKLPTEEMAARLAARVAVDRLTGCHNWTGALLPNHYGIMRAAQRNERTHRVAYVLAKGPIPDGFEIDHLCRNRRCCNPDHLEAVTPRENTLRGVSPSAVNARKTHCSKGHPYDDENTSHRSNGTRRCKACHAAGERARWAARQASSENRL